jgi:hypothetical protein
MILSIKVFFYINLVDWVYLIYCKIFADLINIVDFCNVAVLRLLSNVIELLKQRIVCYFDYKCLNGLILPTGYGQFN